MNRANFWTSTTAKFGFSQVIIEQARKTILVADTMKFQRRAPVQIGRLEDIDIFVTDAPPPRGISQYVQRCQRSVDSR